MPEVFNREYNSAVIKGRVIKLGDNVNTDIIYPGRFMPITSPEEMAKHAFQGISDTFPTRLAKTVTTIDDKLGCVLSKLIPY